MHFSDLVAEGPSVKSEDLCFCAPFSAKFELKKLRMLACDIFVEAFWLGNEQSRYPLGYMAISDWIMQKRQYAITNELLSHPSR